MIDQMPFQEYADAMDEAQAPEPVNEGEEWLTLAKDTFRDSTNYLNSNIRHNWEKAVAHQNSEHANGSKYHSPTYRSRSKTFRPKTRTNNISAEASFAKALFSTSDLVSITPVDDGDPAQIISAEINKQLLQYRLTKSIKWFLTAMGAYQNGRVYGMCVSHQYWDYEETDDGEIIKDKPAIDLLPPENIRFDPNADWRDPLNDSPYVIRIVPKYGIEAFEMTQKEGVYPWRDDITLARLVSAGTDSESDTTRSQREGGGRSDPSDADSTTEFGMVYLHQNFVRKNGKDMVYWTAGSEFLLSDPIEVKEAYPHLRGEERPFAMGIVLLEAHKNYPASPTKLIENLQIDANDVANQRFDNVKLVLNKRYFIRKGATGLDTQALMRSSPGGGVVMGDIDRDVKVLDTNDVTSSSYQEQDRIDLAIDDITGTFSQQSVQNNRNLNETVGGMEMMNSGSNDVSEYCTRVFIETWVEPVIRQLVRLEQYYENDQKILAVAAGKAQSYQTFGIDRMTDELLQQELTINVNVGFGSTSPEQKMNRIGSAINGVGFLPNAIARIDEDEVIREVFGAAGFRDGARFFKPVEEMPEPQEDPMIDLKRQELSLKEQELGMRREYQGTELQLRREIEMAKLALSENIKLSELQSRLGIEQAKEQNKRDIAAGQQTLEQTRIQLQEKNLNQGYDTF